MKFFKDDIVIRKKTGNEYKIVGIGIWEANEAPCYAYSAIGSDMLRFIVASEMEDGRFALKVKNDIEMINLFRAKGALKLETKGLKSRNSPSIFIQVKRMLKIKGNKEVILEALEEYIARCELDRLRSING